MEELPDLEPSEIVNYATKMVWDDQGNPTVIGVPMKRAPAATKMRNLMDEALDLPYDGSDKRYKGLTKGEALIIDLVDQASLGDATARKEVLDRSLGKSVQQINSVSVRGTIEQFLDALPPRQEAPIAKAEIIDVEPNNSAEDL